MSDRLIATSPTRGHRQLGFSGQPVIAAHRQLVAILMSRLSPAHGALLALPRLDPAGQRIDWYTAESGPIRAFTALSETEAAQLRAAAKKISSDIAGLAQSLILAGGTGEVVGRLLDLALLTPDQQCLYSVGGKPVLILWGHQVEASDVGDQAGGKWETRAPKVPENPSGGTARVTSSTAGPSADPSKVPAQETRRWERGPRSQPGSEPDALESDDFQNETDEAGTQQAYPRARHPGQQGRRFALSASASAEAEIGGAVSARVGWRGWLFWALPLLLLFGLVILSLRACTPLPPVVIDVPDPNASDVSIDSTRALEERLAGLHAEQEKLRQDKAGFIGRCVADDPVPPAKAEDLPPWPQPPSPPPVPKPPEAAPSPKSLPGTPAQPKVTPQPVPAPSKAPPEEKPVMPPKPAACAPSFAPGDEPEVVLIVDGSGSMNEKFGGGDSRINQARRSIASTIQGLPPGVDVGLVDFRGCQNVRRDRFYQTGERSQLLNEINGLSPWGGTPLARSIERAGNIVSLDADAVIVVVSDGEESCGGDPCAAARALKAAKPRAVVNVIDISGDSKGRAVIQCVASATGGQVLKPNSSLDLKDKIQKATRQPDMQQCRN